MLSSTFSSCLAKAFVTQGKLIWLLGIAPSPAPIGLCTFDERAQLNRAAASLLRSCSRAAVVPTALPQLPWVPGSTDEFSSNSGGRKWSS